MSVHIGNNSRYKITIIGIIHIRMHDGIIRMLSNVNHVFDLKNNLIFLGILDSNGSKIVIESNNLKLSRGDIILMRGQKVSSLYILQGTIESGSATIIE